ncbi:MAG: hypothetical protein ABI634_14050 [Acidobacteriota bacterium]
MSTYAQVSDIRGLAPSIPINTSSVPTEGQAQDYLNRVESELNAILTNLGYVTPVAASATEARVMLKDLVATGALAKVLRARGLGVDVSLLEAAKVTEKDYRDRLKALKDADDPYELPGATRTDLEASKTPDERSGSFADDPPEDFEIDSPRATRAQEF